MKIKVTEERLKSIKFGVMRRAQRRDIDAMAHMIAHFMTNGSGEYMEPDKAIAVVDDIELGDLESTVKELFNAFDEAAVPK